MLYNQQGLLADALAQYFQDLLNFRFSQPCQRLVQQQDLRFGQDGHGNLQPSLLAQAEMLYLPVGFILKLKGLQGFAIFLLCGIALQVVKKRETRIRSYVLCKKTEPIVDHREIIESGG